MRRNRLKIVYCGLDVLTLELLLENSVYQVCGITDIEDFNTATPQNCFDRFFKYAYQLKKRKNHFAGLAAWLYQFFKQWSSYSFKKCGHFLLLICQSKAEILDLNDLDEIRMFFNNHKIDLTLVNNWWLLDEIFLDLPKHGVINLHPSLLPKYRGSLPTLWSLKNQDKSSALSFIKLNKSMDGGEIIKQVEFNIASDDDAITLEYKIEDLTKKNLFSVIDAYVYEGITLKQKNTEASYTAKYFEYMIIDAENENAMDLINKIKLYPYLWPFDFCYLKTNNGQIKFKDASVIDQLPEGCSLENPGDVSWQENIAFFMSQDRLYVRASGLDGSVAKNYEIC